MAGLSETGFTIKRLQEIIDSYNQKAKELFQDLVPFGDEVDVTANSPLGRIIGVATPSAVDLWEASQDIYSAFDPNSATGIALDNICQFIRVTRLPASSSTVRLKCYGDYNTVIPAGKKVLGNTSKSFSTSTSLTLDGVKAFSQNFSINTVTNSVPYTITITDVNGNVKTCTYTSDGSATSAEISTNLNSQVNSVAGSIVTATLNGETIVVVSDVENDVFTFTCTANLTRVNSTKYVDAVCDEVGAIAQSSNTITIISTPVLGWTSVTNTAATIVGNLGETDDELRERFKNAKYVVGTNTLDSAYSDLISLAGVKDVRIYENDTDATIVALNNLPEHSYMALVMGGDVNEIANTIWKNKPAGIKTHGDTTVSVLDVQGQSRDVKFQQPTEQTVYITVDITNDTEDELYPLDALIQIKQALVDWFVANQAMGKDVRISRLYQPILSVPGFFVAALKIGITASPVGTSNLTINYNQYARTELGNIVINIV
jgi:uncharacterized phage protein gp47/JayE